MGNKINLSSQQIRAIKQSPKGKLPGFINGGPYKEGSIKSFGGTIGTKNNFVGGTIGMDKNKPFGSYNVNGKIKGKFGPQGK